MINKIESFMAVFMCELEQYLQAHLDDLKNISFQSDEANTDRPLKEYLKKIIEDECNGINELSKIKYVQYLKDDTVCREEITDEIRNIYISRVLLPDEITENIKEILKAKKSAVFTNPDLCFELNIDGKVVYETIELKSTKEDAIPGSSVQQISPNEWVVFVKHNKQNVEVTTGRYTNAVNTQLQFPDRSPRPQVSFGELKKWNDQNRTIDEECIQFLVGEENAIKEKLLTDWQGVLAERWVDVVFNEQKKNREPWFNNNLRKFVLLFINRYENMTQDEKQSFIDTLNDLVE